MSRLLKALIVAAVISGPLVTEVQAAEPSMWSKMSRSTTTFFRKTTDFLTPSFMKSKKRPIRPQTGTRRVVRANPPKKSNSWFPFSFTSSKKKEKAGSVQSFIGQDRPGF